MKPRAIRRPPTSLVMAARAARRRRGQVSKARDKAAIAARRTRRCWLATGARRRPGRSGRWRLGGSRTLRMPWRPQAAARAGKGAVAAHGLGEQRVFVACPRSMCHGTRLPSGRTTTCGPFWARSRRRRLACVRPHDGPTGLGPGRTLGIQDGGWAAVPALPLAMTRNTVSGSERAASARTDRWRACRGSRLRRRRVAGLSCSRRDHGRVPAGRAVLGRRFGSPSCWCCIASSTMRRGSANGARVAGERCGCTGTGCLGYRPAQGESCWR